MFAGFVVHLFAFVAVNGLLVAIWALTGDGSFEELRGYATEPDTLETAFWPVWVLLPWATGLVIHLGAVLAFGVFGRGSRHRREERRRGVLDAVTGLATPSAAPPPASAPAGRQWVTVMFTDIVESTQLNEALGDDDWSRLLREHRELVRRAFLAREGVEVSSQGDGFLARFPSPAEAVLCGIDIQQGVADRRGEGGVVPAVRIGIHAGEAVEDAGDLIGRVVNVASRVASEAGPDEILVTEPVADYVGGRIVLEDRGVRELKGVAQPRHLLSVVWTPEEAAEPAP